MSITSQVPIHWTRGQHHEYEAFISKFESILGFDFSDFSYFSSEVLANLQREIPLQKNVLILAELDPSVLADLPQISLLAGRPIAEITEDVGRFYQSLLADIYTRLPGIQGKLRREGVIYIGVRREGHKLASELGFIRDHDWGPDLKRALCGHGGLLIGIDGLPKDSFEAKEAVIFDGAIASGATLVTILKRLSDLGIKSVSIFSVHATIQGLRAIVNSALDLGVSVQVEVGICSGTLNDHYYAVDEQGSLILGDVGDIIVGPLDGPN